MDDSCAVCADTLEWVAYGVCGHKEVCSTCVVRLRFICGDNCCCICKTESKTIFVTKALGDYTKAINDFSLFPVKDKEGQSGSDWYHEDTQSYYDDFEQYKMIKAMCRLSCSVCDKDEIENSTENGSKRRTHFRNIRELKYHLSYKHKLFMCNLCLKGRKVFICEQKLYTKAQLEQHKNTGDSQVDGTEIERGGFKGHVLCKFCKSWFYEDNELYTHMETEHYHCSICKGRNIGKYDYYKNYEDLEIHFRKEHFYCEEAVCLSKKFVVFPSEAEMKLHRTQEHVGHMSRARRNAALQLPTSFTYVQTSEHGNRRCRRQNNLSEPEPSSSSESSHETANIDARFQEASTSSVFYHDNDVNDFDELIQPFEALLVDSNQTSRYLMAVSSKARIMPPEESESAFPPLSTGSDAIPQNPKSLLSHTHIWSTLTRSKSIHNNKLSPHSDYRPESALNQWSTIARLKNNNNSQQSHDAASSSTSSWRSTSNISHSVSDFPSISTWQRHNVPANGPSIETAKELCSANKRTVDKTSQHNGQYVLKPLKNDEESSSSYDKSKQKQNKTSRLNEALVFTEVASKGVWCNGGGHRLIGKDQKRG